MTDEGIEFHLKVPKVIVDPGTRWKTQSGSSQKNHQVTSTDSVYKYRIFLRQNSRLPNSFTAGLAYCPEHGEEVILARYNGSDHEHSNPLEGKNAKFSGTCHIHVATARYIGVGRKSEHFATPTNRYDDLEGALLALCIDCTISGLKGSGDTPPSQPCLDFS